MFWVRSRSNLGYTLSISINPWQKSFIITLFQLVVKSELPPTTTPKDLPLLWGQVNFVRIPLFCWAPPDVSGLRFRRLYEGLLAENIVDGPRKRVIRAPPPDMVVSSPAAVKKKRRQQSCEPSTSHGRTYNDPVNYYIDTDSSNHSSCSLDLRGKHLMLYSAAINVVL